MGLPDGRAGNERVAKAGKRTGEIKNGVGLFRYPRRRDIAPTGELAGLSARDSPKPCLLRTPSQSSEAAIHPAKINGQRGGRFITDSETIFA
jgi:hypothetical protein